MEILAHRIAKKSRYIAFSFFILFLCKTTAVNIQQVRLQGQVGYESEGYGPCLLLNIYANYLHKRYESQFQTLLTIVPVPYMYMQ